YVNDVEMRRDVVTLAHVLQGSGYETGMAGKWHLDGPPRPGWMSRERSMGFADCRWMYNRGHWKRIVERPQGWPQNRSRAAVGKKPEIASKPDGRPDITYSATAPGEYFTNWLTDKAIEFLGQPRSKPFFYYLSIPDPHTPFSVGAPYDTMYKSADMPVPRTLYQKNMPDWAERFRSEYVRAEGSASWDDPNREKVLRERKAQYCGMVKCIDDNVGRLLRFLEEKKLLDDTLIVFSSDHGQYMGEHGLYMKNALYETAYRVPLMMRWPAKIRAGSQVQRCIGGVDIVPTLCGLLDVKPPAAVQGHDASALATGRGAAWKDEVFIHHSSLEYAGIFTPEWELIVPKKGEVALFDRRNDPDQVNNLASSARYQSVVADLRRRVLSHNREVHAPAAAWLEASSA
ncbi:MAG: sulfatase-like hydrolase/transferase, partial [Acidobacteria bacterium]|nr:sulfatase-like hydrolase/transferase [Acidobacteriota bacterium]